MLKSNKRTYNTMPQELNLKEITSLSYGEPQYL